MPPVVPITANPDRLQAGPGAGTLIAHCRSSMIIVVTGVAGAGKTTVGTMLAAALGCGYLEGDSLHPLRNVEAMMRGVALTDADRAPWLAVIHERLVEAFARGDSLVVGCSALKESYRRTLSAGIPVIWVYLKGPAELIRSRLRDRTGHFFPLDMLAGQLEALEEPQGAIVVDISQPPSVIVEHILARLPGKPEVRVSADLDELGARTAEAVAATLREVVEATGRCSLALSGGTTPGGLYRTLSARFRDDVPWADVHVFWSDERYVPADDVRSNYRMACETFLEHVPCPPANIHPMPTGFADPAEAARVYEEILKDHFAGAAPTFDLAILGVGADGHTASLFPGAPALRERTRWVLSVTVAAEPPARLTLTLPVLNASARTWFLVAGSNKAPAVREVLSGSADPRQTPAAAIRPSHGNVIWWLDQDAAAQLEPGGNGVADLSLAARPTSASDGDDGTD